MSRRHLQLNGREIAKELFGGTDEDQRGEWVVYGIKKANAIFAKRGEEALIFTGRYSTPAKVEQWLTDHPTFVANQVLAPVRKKKPRPAKPVRPPRPQHRAA